jgi:hypothetical protein
LEEHEEREPGFELRLHKEIFRRDLREARAVREEDCEKKLARKEMNSTRLIVVAGSLPQQRQN